jgi:hypothetical protein
MHTHKTKYAHSKKHVYHHLMKPCMHNLFTKKHSIQTLKQKFWNVTIDALQL